MTRMTMSEDRSESMAVRVRFAPSPTGFLHIGGLRTALYNELLARHLDGQFILRIEDTDRTRYVAGAVENILRTLDWAGLKPDEGPYLAEDGTVKERGDYGPYVQSARLDKYKQAAEELLKRRDETDAPVAYRCFCSQEEIETLKAEREAAGAQTVPGLVAHKYGCRGLSEEESSKRAAEGPSVIRLRVPDRAGYVEIHDAIRGRVRFDYSAVDDQVLMKSDGYPTYHLANVVDDHEMRITHVIRGEEWLPSAPKHVLIYRAFGWTPPVFAHLPLLLNPDRSKLSKRQGDVAAEDYRRQGYLPEALINFIALLGWNPSGSQEKYSKQQLIREFNLEKINKAGAVFNREKLDWLNGEYLKELPDNRLVALAIPFFEERGLLRTEGTKVVIADSDEPVSMEMLNRALSLDKSRAKTLAALPEATEFFFKERLSLQPAMIPWKKSTPEVAKERLYGLRDYLATLDDHAFDDPKALEGRVIPFIAEKGWTNADSLWPLRVALTGREKSPSPFEVAWVLGKGKTLARVEDAINILP